MRAAPRHPHVSAALDEEARQLAPAPEEGGVERRYTELVAGNAIDLRAPREQQLYRLALAEVSRQMERGETLGRERIDRAGLLGEELGDARRLPGCGRLAKIGAVPRVQQERSDSG